MNNKVLAAAVGALAMAIISGISTAACAQSAATEKAGAARTAHQRTLRVLAENEKMQVIEVVYQPGDAGAASSKDGLAVYHLSAGTIERSYADGSKKVVTYKAGQTTLIADKRVYSTKNIGKTTVHEIVFQLK